MEGNEKFPLIVAYGPNEEARKEDIETFFDWLRTLIEKLNT